MTTENTKSIRENDKDYGDLKKAVALLQSPSVIARISNLIGSPLESATKKLPKAVTEKMNGAVEAALQKAAEAALWSLDNKPNTPASTVQNKLLSAVSGAVGGAFGFTSLFIELPVSTTIMMRSVADIARSEGFDLSELSTKQACIEVFAMGGNDKADDATEIGYYVTRGFTTEAMKQLSKELAALAAKNGTAALNKITATQAGKWLAALIEKVAARFGVVISTKFAAQAVPIIGAVTGATLNTLFTDYYQDVAKGHFTVKRLENKYGFEEIKKEYEELAKALKIK
jgi:EcsC protein family